jgi:hypothetical protein
MGSPFAVASELVCKLTHSLAAFVIFLAVTDEGVVFKISKETAHFDYSFC